MNNENSNSRMDPEAEARLAPPRDAVLDPLLDEALSPEAAGIPADLAERIVARTAPMLGRPGVLARIGPMRLGTAVAALLALAATIGLVLRWGGPDAAPTPALHEQVRGGLAHLAYAGDEPFDRELALLAHRIDRARRPIDWEAVARMADELDERLDAGEQGAVF